MQQKYANLKYDLTLYINTCYAKFPNKINETISQNKHCRRVIK